jgi:hypothetical protein
VTFENIQDYLEMLTDDVWTTLTGEEDLNIGFKGEELATLTLKSVDHLRGYFLVSSVFDIEAVDEDQILTYLRGFVHYAHISRMG